MISLYLFPQLISFCTPKHTSFPVLFKSSRSFQVQGVWGCRRQWQCQRHLASWATKSTKKAEQRNGVPKNSGCERSYRSQRLGITWVMGSSSSEIWVVSCWYSLRVLGESPVNLITTVCKIQDIAQTCLYKLHCMRPSVILNLPLPYSATPPPHRPSTMNQHLRFLGKTRV